MRSRLPIAVSAVAWALASASPAQLPPPTPRPSPAAGPVEQALLLEGRPFPPAHPRAFRPPDPKRTFFAAAGGEAGDGSEARPWNDLQAALARLAPGDRLRVRAGSYAATVSIEEGCADGTERAPIQLVFDGKAVLAPPDGKPALVVARAHWLVLGPYARLGRSSESPGIVVRGSGAHDLRIEGARVSDGLGPGIRVEPEAARVTLGGAYVSKSGLQKMGPASSGIEIAAGTREVEVAESHLSNNPSGSIRVRAPEGGRRPARDVEIRENSIRDDGAASIAVEAADGLTIAGNTLTDSTGVAGTRGIALERVERASVRTNRVSGYSIGVAVGRAEPKGGPVHPAADVWVERNVVECAPGREGAAAFVVEAGSAIRIVNNLADGCADGVLLFGAPPQTEKVVVANDVLLRVSDVALILQSPASATLFDYNVFSPSGPVTAEVGGRSLSLARFLREGTMPNTQIKSGVRVLNRELARVSGVPTVDRGKTVPGLQYRGAAPDLGVAER
jgi:hypothetical protein